MTPVGSIEWHEAQVKALERQVAEAQQKAVEAANTLQQLIGAHGLATAYLDAVRKAAAPEEAKEDATDD